MLPKMRTLPQAAKELKRADPQTSITLPVLRRLVKEGVIPVVYSGTRAFVNLRTFGSYLSQPANKESAGGKIRKIGE